MSGIKMVNFYDHIKTKDDGLRRYPNEKEIQIKLPARILLLGPSGSGKTSVLLNLIKFIGIFDKIILLAKNLDEPLYKHLIETYRKLEKRHKTSIILAINDLKDLPGVDDCNPKENTLFICDDFICEAPKLLKKVEEFWVRGRKNGVTMAFLSQSYFDTPKMIRKNSNYIIIKRIGNPKDLKRILSEYKLGIDDDQLEQLYTNAMNRGELTDFFMIDLETTDPQLRFRSNFSPQSL